MKAYRKKSQQISPENRCTIYKQISCIHSCLSLLSVNTKLHAKKSTTQCRSAWIFVNSWRATIFEQTANKYHKKTQKTEGKTRGFRGIWPTISGDHNFLITTVFIALLFKQHFPFLCINKKFPEKNAEVSSAGCLVASVAQW